MSCCAQLNQVGAAAATAASVPAAAACVDERRLLVVVQVMNARTHRQPSHKKDTRLQAAVVWGVEARAVVCALVRCCSTGGKLKVGKRLRSGWGAVAVGTAPHTRLMCVSPWVGLRSEAAQGGLPFCCDSCPNMPGTAAPVRAIRLPWQMRDVITRVGAIMRRAESQQPAATVQRMHPLVARSLPE